MGIARSFRKFERKFDARASRFLWQHPLLGLLSVFVGMPVFVLLCVCAGTAAIALPIAWLFSWL